MSHVSGAVLLRLARQAIEASFAGRPVVVPPEPWLREPGAVFVTLRQRRDHALRGCIGSIEAREPLGDAIVTAAVGAAFRDPRFAPLVASELPFVHLDISVLSPLTPLPVTSEADAVAQLGRLRPGVVFHSGRRSSVLLPQVWASIADPAEFLQHLKMKAGLPASFWSPSVELSVFTCEEFAEPADDSPAHREAS
jgi:AmmeMemoRadiSam system protein A